MQQHAGEHEVCCRERKKELNKFFDSVMDHLVYDEFEQICDDHQKANNGACNGVNCFICN